MIRGAARGNANDRERFAALYLPVVRSYLEARWRGSPLLAEQEDTAQDVFLECMKDGGALTKVRPGGGPGGFRAYLHRVALNVARRVEEKKARRREKPAGGHSGFRDVETDDPSLAEAFDRAWAIALVRQAVALYAERAEGDGHRAGRRVELLRLQFQEGLRIPEIARRWSEDVGRLYQESYHACAEFSSTLKAVVAFHCPENPESIHDEYSRLLEYFES